MFFFLFLLERVREVISYFVFFYCRFHKDTKNGLAPYFVFGDFNFRCDTEGVVKVIKLFYIFFFQFSSAKAAFLWLCISPKILAAILDSKERSSVQPSHYGL